MTKKETNGKTSKKEPVKKNNNTQLVNKNNKTTAFDLLPITDMSLPTTPISSKISDNWGRDGVYNELEKQGLSSLLVEKLDKIIDYLNSIESELIHLNETRNTSTHNDIMECNMESLLTLQKQAADTIQRNNYREGQNSPEMLFARNRFEKITSIINKKLNEFVWD